MQYCFEGKICECVIKHRQNNPLEYILVFIGR